MIKGSKELIRSAQEEMEREMKRSIEKRKQPSFLEMYFSGYAQGYADTDDYVKDKAKKAFCDAICRDGERCQVERMSCAQFTRFIDKLNGGTLQDSK